MTTRPASTQYCMDHTFATPSQNSSDLSFPRLSLSQEEGRNEQLKGKRRKANLVPHCMINDWVACCKVILEPSSKAAVVNSSFRSPASPILARNHITAKDTVALQFTLNNAHQPRRHNQWLNHACAVAP